MARIVSREDIDAQIAALGLPEWTLARPEQNLQVMTALGYLPIIETEVPGYLVFPCPGCWHLLAIDVQRADGWMLAGTRDAPTISPSIKHVDCSVGFHVVISNGEFPWRPPA